VGFNMGKKGMKVSVENMEVLSDFEKLRKTVTGYASVIFFLVFAGLIGLYAFIDFAAYPLAVFVNGGVLAVLILVGIFIMSRKVGMGAIILSLILGPALFANIWLYLGKEIGIHYLFVVLAILPFITINRQYKFFQWLFGLSNIAIFAFLLNSETLGSLSDALPAIVFTIGSYSFIALSLLFISLMFVIYTQTIEKYEALLKVKEQEVIEMAAEIRRMAIEDTSTGAVTHRKLEELILTEIARSDRYETPFSLIMFSLSDIKEVFAVYGQEKGEKIMEQLVNIVRTDLRLVDILGRWTDGEFVIFMPEIKLHQAVYVAQRLVAIISKTEFLPKIKLPSNFAVIQRLPGENFESLTVRLHQMMKKSIEEGENRIYN
jgi:diguanylate cyclase (GGDEF)-like protein